MPTAGNSKLYLLWLFAALIAFVAAAIAYSRRQEIDAASLVLALVGLGMGYMSWARNRKASE